jgi:hypothetical protein
MLYFIKGFFSIYSADQVVFVFASLTMLYDIVQLEYVELSLYHWDKVDLVMVFALSDILLKLVCHYLIKNFCIYIHQRDWVVILIFYFVPVHF